MKTEFEKMYLSIGEGAAEHLQDARYESQIEEQERCRLCRDHL
jgi:hypothetical protein